MRIFVVLTFLFCAVLLKAQETNPELVTDRPDQTESSAVVPLKAFQIETGFWKETKEYNGFEAGLMKYNTTLIRYGLLEDIELRMGLEYMRRNYGFVDLEGESQRGLGPLYTGAKFKVLDERGAVPEVAFLVGLTWPFSASDGFQPDYLAPDMRIAASHTISKTFSLGYNFGAEWSGMTPNPGYFYSAALGIGILDKLGMFLESYGILYKEGQGEHMLDAGFTYLILSNLQVDLSGGIGISEHAIDNFISFGISYRIH